MKTINVNYINTGTFVLGDDDAFLCTHEGLSVWYDKACDEMHIECSAQDCTGVTDDQYYTELKRQDDEYDAEWLDAEYWRGVEE